ncbi:MAG: hypothetical protein SNG49_05245 [Rikenellaceae bacterium]
MEQKCAEGEQIADLQNKHIPVIPDLIWDLQPLLPCWNTFRWIHLLL